MPYRGAAVFGAGGEEADDEDEGEVGKGSGEDGVNVDWRGGIYKTVSCTVLQKIVQFGEQVIMSLLPTILRCRLFLLLRGFFLADEFVR